MTFRSIPNRSPVLCLFGSHHPPYILNMTFDNDLSTDSSFRDQLTSHLPVALIALGVGAAFVALHVAIAGLAALALLHVVGGAGLLAFRRHRASGGAK